MEMSSCLEIVSKVLSLCGSDCTSGEVSSEQSHGEKLCDSVVQFYRPEGPIQLEVVFVHDLEHGNCGDAYWKTWVARDGTPNNVWLKTWLPAEVPFAQVFALKYDASIKRSAAHGRMDLYTLGENLVQEMGDFGRIGQNGVPVVFVCHGVGGLVAKQIIVSARHRFSESITARNLFENIGALLFYSTPHHGSHLAKCIEYICKGGGKGPLLENSEVLNTEISRLNHEFEEVARGRDWYFDSAAGTHETVEYGAMVVEEASSRYEGGKYLPLGVDHFDICRPETKQDSSFLWLIKCLEEVLAREEIHLQSKAESLVLESHVKLREQEETIKGMLQNERIIGLVGVGGIGKTTLAKAVFESIRKEFEKCSYLDDVKSKASLDEVLVVLLQDFGIKERKTGRIAQQNDWKDSKRILLEELKMYVQQHKVLVVVDDIGTRGNFKRLLEDMGYLSGNKESRLIVTCRNWQELKDNVDGGGKYEVEVMSSGEDIEMFSYHAFKGARTWEMRREVLLASLSKDSSEHMMVDFERVCDEVVEACGGLPLSLEVMGGCLGRYIMDVCISSGKCLEYWRGALEKLKNAEPLEGGVDNDRLWKVLEVGYHALHKNEQNMFLDIACFFCDSTRYGEETLLRTWGGNQSSKSIQLLNLRERCLIKIDKKNGVVKMHDQLRDMGRNIARDQAGGVLNQMTRIWDYKDVSRLLQNKQITSTVLQGLSLEHWDWKSRANMVGHSVVTSKWQKHQEAKGVNLNCPEMKLLNLCEVEEEFIHTIHLEDSSSLQWLCFQSVNISNEPEFLWVCEELQVLDMTNCESLITLQESIGNLVNLRELRLSNCWRLEILPRSIGKLVKLSELGLCGCTSLASIPDSIGELVNLSKVDFFYCKGLTSLPQSIGKLVKLSRLNLSECTSLASVPESIGELVNLSKLDLSFCSRLTSLPQSISKLVKLSELGLHCCYSLMSVPDTIGELVNLSKLDLSSCIRLTSLPQSIGKLVKLSELYLFACTSLTSVPDTISKLMNLSKLYLSSCEGLTSLPQSIGKLMKLSELGLSYCTSLTSVPDSIGELVNLSKLDLSFCEGMTSLPQSIGKLVKLFELGLRCCYSLGSVPDSIGELVNLSKLDLSSCSGLTSLPQSIGKLVKLSEFYLFACTSLMSVPDTIGELVNLSKLDLSSCIGLTSLPQSIGKLVKLSELYLLACTRLTSVPDTIGKLMNLSKFYLSSCEGLTSLPQSIGKLMKLSELGLSYCTSLASVPDSIGELVNLSKLDLSFCEGMTSLPQSIGKLVKLFELGLRCCYSLGSVPDSIGELVNLSKLDLSYCKGLTSLPKSIGKLVKLSELGLCCCTSLASIPDSIGKLVNLSKLDLSSCKGLTSLPQSIGKLVKLSELHLFDCTSLTSVPDSIGELVNLSKLHLSYCKGLTILPQYIGKLVKLSELGLSYCTSLASVPDSIGELVKLSKLDLSGCTSLVSVPDSIGKLVNLSELRLYNCLAITSLPDSIGNLFQLETLDIVQCPKLVKLPQSLGRLSRLSCLNLQDSIKWEWMKASQVSVLHELQQHCCSKILLPDGRVYHGKYSTEYCSSGAAGCDGCGLGAIFTKCWHCDLCPEFDLCESCYERGSGLELLQSEHKGDHPMTAIAVLC